MKPFRLDAHMVTLRGVFYPTGHVVLMLQDRDAVDKAADAIVRAGIAGDEMSLLSPDTILGPIARTIGSSGATFPSPGSEADMVRQMTDHASNGEWGLIVHTPHTQEAERVMRAVHGMPVTMAERYRQLVIEDLES